MTYGHIHRFLLRSVASRGVMSITESQAVLHKIADNEEIHLEDIVKEINTEIRPFKQAIKVTNDEMTNERVLVFVSLGYDDATKSQNVFSVTELEYFRVLIEQIMTTETRQITGILALNLVSNVKTTFTKSDAQKLLKLWCRMRYLDKDENNYALGIRAIHEFEGYLRENMPDTVEECCLCKQVVFRGVNCPACAKAIHTRCLNKYLEKVKKWPCCQIEFCQEQIEQLNQEESSRVIPSISQTEVVETSLPSDESTSMEVTQPTQEGEENHMIPEISQRVTRKRKRQIQ
ncbi:non-structural maintenance of chromosomes element 1 homolog [Manduca sexta]|uniref:non-structural maintenance of chromosomes element 1 homolog n=1 Tax=Manduca sexta TaxID=7130 RepID=UPI0018904494|nr:non-structural maintenance of chromosomes element 1 homolog [Manduca sexta]